MPQVITRELAVAAPETYKLGATDTLNPRAIFARFDGSAAAGAFRPCVTYYTQDGLVFARSFPADEVAAGASADVSWFPGLKAGSSSSPTDTDDYVRLDEQIVTFGGTTDITFSSIDQTYRHLILYLSVGIGGGANFTRGNVRFTINSGITTYNYRSYTNYTLSNSSTTSVGTYIEMTNAAPPAPAGGNLNNHGWGQHVLVFPYYARASHSPTVTWQGVSMGDLLSGSGDTGVAVAASGPLTDLDFILSGGTTTSFTVGSRASLYGVR